MHGYTDPLAHPHTHPQPHTTNRYPYNDTRSIGPPLRARGGGPFFDARVGRYAFRFPGSDSAVVKASQRMVRLSVVYIDIDI